MDSFGTRKKQKINQCELLVVIAAVMTFGDVFCDRELLVWVDNVPALSAAVHGYSHAAEMASLSNALHLLLAGLSAIPRFLHVPGKANPADIPSPPWQPGRLWPSRLQRGWMRSASGFTRRPSPPFPPVTKLSRTTVTERTRLGRELNCRRYFPCPALRIARPLWTSCSSPVTFAP